MLLQEHGTEPHAQCFSREVVVRDFWQLQAKLSSLGHRLRLSMRGSRLEDIGVSGGYKSRMGYNQR